MRIPERRRCRRRAPSDYIPSTPHVSPVPLISNNQLGSKQAPVIREGKWQEVTVGGEHTASQEPVFGEDGDGVDEEDGYCCLFVSRVIRCEWWGGSVP